MKFCGIVGFWVGEAEDEDRPGVWKSLIEERPYFGDVLRNTRRFQSSDKQNDDLIVSNQISILSDLYAQQNWNSIRYVVWNEVKWKVTSVEVSYPRLILEIGGVYNGPDKKSEWSS